jgi:hypothetical protein
MNFFERVLMIIAPAWACRRLQARQALADLNGGSQPPEAQHKRPVRSWLGSRNGKDYGWQDAALREASGDEIRELMERRRDRDHDDGWRRVEGPEDFRREAEQTGWLRRRT